jgi:hypothetical protein
LFAIAAPGCAAADGASASERRRVLGPFLSEHWRLPIAEQGPPPANFSEVEASFAPEVCGSCHPQQLAQWQTSFHARAFSPGFAGQLIEGGLAEPAERRGCQRCHTPLAEQQAFDAAHAENQSLNSALRLRGVVCAGCHVRGRATLGPPRREGAPVPAEPPPHGGFEARAEFTESRFCAECHQFFDDTGINGKPLENTWAEWRASPMAAAGRTCQSCHMPDRAHLWRGIHDRETVRAAVEIALVTHDSPPDRIRGALVLRNRDVGHLLPTYVTPRIFLDAWQVDAGGEEIPETRSTVQVGRQVDFNRSPWHEVFDTRVAPGESVKLDYDGPRTAAAAALVGRVTVDPDFHYRGVYEELLTRYRDPDARRMIAEALRIAEEAIYVLAEYRIEL